MIYDEPRFTPGGDRFIEMELGDELNFDLNFLVHALTARVREADFDGIIELLPNMASIVISYDPDRIGYDDVVREIGGIFASLGSLEDVELPSPLYTFPVLYFDHVTRACWEDYCARIVEKEYDPDLMVRLNKLESRAQLARIHSGTEYWVAALGFYPGLASLIALDPRCRLTAPKYNPPRTWTPKGTLGYGGSVTCLYPARTPGGYQIIGHSPVPVVDLEQRLARLPRPPRAAQTRRPRALRPRGPGGVRPCRGPGGERRVRAPGRGLRQVLDPRLPRLARDPRHGCQVLSRLRTVVAASGGTRLSPQQRPRLSPHFLCRNRLDLSAVEFAGAPSRLAEPGSLQLGVGRRAQGRFPQNLGFHNSISSDPRAGESGVGEHHRWRCPAMATPYRPQARWRGVCP